MVGHFGYCILANWRLPFEVASRKRQSAIAGGNKINMTHALRFSRFSTATFLSASGGKAAGNCHGKVGEKRNAAAVNGTDYTQLASGCRRGKTFRKMINFRGHIAWEKGRNEFLKPVHMGK